MRDDIQVNDLALQIEDELVEKLSYIYDGEIELDIYNLGLIYEINLDEEGHCQLMMTFTDTNCGCEDTLPQDIIDTLLEIDRVKKVSVNIVWKPVWKPTRISRLGRIALGISPR